MIRSVRLFLAVLLLVLFPSGAAFADKQCEDLPFDESLATDYRRSVCQDEREITYQASFEQPKMKIFKTTKDLLRQVFNAVGLGEAARRDASVELWLQFVDVNPDNPCLVALARTKSVTMGMLMKNFHRGLSKETISLSDLSVFLEESFPETKGYKLGEVRVSLGSIWDPDDKTLEQELRGILRKADPKSIDRVYSTFARIKTKLLDEDKYCERLRSVPDPNGLIDSCGRIPSDSFYTDGSVKVGGFSFEGLEESGLDYQCLGIHRKYPEVQFCQTGDSYSYELTIRLSKRSTLSRIRKKIRHWLQSSSLPESVWAGASWELWLESLEKGLVIPELWATVLTSDTNLLFDLGSILAVVTPGEVDEFHQEAVRLLGDDRYPEQTGYQVGEVLLWLGSNYGGKNSDDEQQLKRLVKKAGYKLSIHPYTSHLRPGHVKVRTEVLDEFPFCRRLMTKEGAPGLIEKCRPPEAGRTSEPTQKVLLIEDRL